MGQKIHPEGFRVGYVHDWKSNWFDERNFADLLLEDMAIRDHIEGKLAHAGLSDINNRQAARRDHGRHRTPPGPGSVIGKSGAEVDALLDDVDVREAGVSELALDVVADRHVGLRSSNQFNLQ